MAALDLGYMANAAAVRDMKPEVVYLLGADSGAISKEDLPEGAFVIYQVFHALPPRVLLLAVWTIGSWPNCPIHV